MMSAERPALPGLLQQIARMARALFAAADGSAMSLVVANVLALAIARLYGMSLRDLMFVYWLQSVIIGAAHAVRMLCLKDYSKVGYNDRYGRPLDTTGLGKVNFAIQFIVVYGFVHLIFLLFIAFQPGKHGGPEWNVPPLGELLVCGLTFAADQVYSTARKIKLDRQGRPRVPAMMSAPFVRILPMHATILLGGLSFGREVGALWWLFAGLKSVADVLMHVRDERAIQEALIEKRMMDEALARLALPLQEAVMWYRECAEKGDAEAQLNLGRMYLQGRGVPQSNSEALMWLSKASDQNNVEAAALIADGKRSGRW
jgi:hypothetical protein